MKLKLYDGRPLIPKRTGIHRLQLTWAGLTWEVTETEAREFIAKLRIELDKTGIQ